jgi:hypothetical protein
LYIRVTKHPILNVDGVYLQVLPGQIETHYCSSPIPADLFDSPLGTTSEVPFASSAPYYHYTSIPDTQMIAQKTPPAYVQQQTLENPYVGNSQNYIQPTTSIQQEFQFTKKKYTFYMEVR